MLFLFKDMIIAVSLKSTLMDIVWSLSEYFISIHWANLMIRRLVNPYVSPVLYIRRPGDDSEITTRFADDDPFFSEVSNLIDIIEDIEEDPDAAQILSSYEGLLFYFTAECLILMILDAVRTYEFTWAIRRASERSRAERPWWCCRIRNFAGVYYHKANRPSIDVYTFATQTMI